MDLFPAEKHESILEDDVLDLDAALYGYKRNGFISIFVKIENETYLHIDVFF